MIRIVLDGERPISWNEYYSGKHWSKRKREADRVHMLMRVNMPSEFVNGAPLEDKVNITVRAFFSAHPYDPCNIPAKLYIDGLKGWVIKDDSPKYVGAVTTISEVDRKNPRVEISVKEI